MDTPNTTDNLSQAETVELVRLQADELVAVHAERRVLQAKLNVASQANADLTTQLAAANAQIASLQAAAAAPAAVPAPAAVDPTAAPAAAA